MLEMGKAVNFWGNWPRRCSSVWTAGVDLRVIDAPPAPGDPNAASDAHRPPPKRRFGPLICSQSAALNFGNESERLRKVRKRLPKVWSPLVTKV